MRQRNCLQLSALLLAFTLAASGCGGFTQSAPETRRDATVTVALSSGSSKPGFRDVLSDGSLESAKLTGIALQITADGMTTINETIPLDTLKTTLLVPSGANRTFRATVSVAGQDFYGYATDVDIDPNSISTIDISLTLSGAIYTVSGTVSSLAGTGLTLQLNGSTTLPISSDGSFEFSTSYMATGQSYSVTVSQGPSSPNQTCTVSNGSGLIAASDVSDVVVNCVTTRYGTGGSVSGLTGTVVLQNNSTDNLTLTSDSAFTFATDLDDGSAYDVTVSSQPSGQTCTVGYGEGTLSGADITNVMVTCAAITYSVSGSVSGLTGTGLVLQNLGVDNLSLSADGAFTFSSAIADGSGYYVTVYSQPLGQTCSVSSGSGTVSGANVSGASVSCVDNRYSVGGTLSGLGGTVVLQNSSGDDLTLTSDGSFSFATTLADSASYSVTVSSQPSGQTCTVGYSAGAISRSDVTNVTVNCATNSYSVGGTLSGLTGTVVLQNLGGDDLALSTDGVFTFASSIAAGSRYNVTVKTQPSSRSCSVSDSVGTVGAANVTSVIVTCVNSAGAYTVGGTVLSLTGSGLVLQNSLGNDLSITSDGSFSFSAAIVDDSSYNVTVKTQPSGQGCSVSDGSGTISGANVTDVTVTCTPDRYRVGGTVSGLSGSGLVLQNSLGNDQPISGDGSFIFTTALGNGSGYSVTVKTQPSGQSCTVGSGTGTLSGADVTNVAVTCAVNIYTVGGSVSGLTGTVILQNNSGDDLTLSANGLFTFASAIADGSGYNVTVSSQPSGQSCGVSSGSGAISGANVTTVTITCASGVNSISGTLSGLTGSGLVLQNNGGDDIAVSFNGSFTFAGLIADGSNYDVTVKTQPTNQTCTVSNGSGTTSGANVTDVSITCEAGSFTVGGAVSGLSGTVILQNNSADDLTLNSDGTFTFPAALSDGSTYSVSVSSQPSGQTCTVGYSAGTVAGSDVTTVTVSCATNSYTVGGSVSGLTGTVVLQNLSGDDLAISSNGSFTFSSSVADSSSYNVTVKTQPSGQSCTVGYGSGTLSAANVTSVAVTCSANSYRVGGTVSGVTSSGLVLQNRLGDDLSILSSGSFTFATALADGSSYDVTVKSQPSGLTCSLSGGSGTLSGADVATVSVTCLSSSYSGSRFAKVYSSTGDNTAHSGTVTSDSGYIFAGHTDSTGAGSDDFLVVKLDSDGSVVWEKSYGDVRSNMVRDIVQTSDGGYLVAGSTFTGAKSYEVYLMKLDSTGGLTWSKQYGGDDSDWIYSVRQTSDSGYILAGNTDSFGGGTDTDMWVLKLDSSGNEQSHTRLGGSATDTAHSIRQTNDGGYVLTGITASYGAGTADLMVVKMDSSLAVTWAKSYGGTGNQKGQSIQQTADDGYIVAGYSDSFGSSGAMVWVLKLDSSGNVTWERALGGSSSEQAQFVRQTSDSGYIVVAYTSSFGAGSNDFWVIRLDSFGNTVWDKTFGGSGSDWPNSVHETSDGGFLISGETDSFGVSGSNMATWLLKIGDDGSLGCGYGVDTSHVELSTNATVSGQTVGTGSVTNSYASSTPTITDGTTSFTATSQCTL